MTELETRTEINGNEVLSERTCAFSGDTVYTIRNDNGHLEDVDENGNSVTAWELSSPTDASNEDFVQTNPDGAQIITNTAQERMLDHATPIFGVLPDGTVTAALTHDTLVWSHYNDEYVNYRDTPLEKAINRLVSPRDTMLTVEANRYWLYDDVEVGHTYGTLERVDLSDIPVRERGEAARNAIKLLKNGNLPISAPVLIRGTNIYTHENHTGSLADSITAENSL